MLSPSVHRFLTTLALGDRDFRALAALMVKPRSSVMMTFAADPIPASTSSKFQRPRRRVRVDRELLVAYGDLAVIILVVPREAGQP